jgi:molybdenum cofactor cytidylyltransferase
MSEPPVVIVLAAGRGERFAASGGQVHKLDALLGGRRVIDHVLRAVLESGLPHHVVRLETLPDFPRASGMGDSIAAGVAATVGAPGWLILPADLPLIRADTLRRMAMRGDFAVAVPVHRGVRGHPVHFAAECGPELLNLKGNQGAAQVIRAQAAINSVAFIEVDDDGCVTDIDTLDDLRRAELLLAQR